MNKIKLAVLIAVLLALLLPITALASGLPEDKVVFGGTYTLESGEFLDGNLIIFGGAATLEPESTVGGDVVVFGGSLQAGGMIEGSIIGIGGLVELEDTAVVENNVVTAGANLDQSPLAVVEGDVTSELDFRGPFTFDSPRIPRMPDLSIQLNPFVEIMWLFLRTLLWAALAVVLVLLLPRHLDAIGMTAIREPLLSGGLGLLTAVLAPVVLVILAITICLSPFALIGVLILIVAWGLGLVALGLQIGKRLAERMNQDWAPALSAGLGTLLLVFVIDGLRIIIPCVGWIFPAVAGMVGLGAVLLTRFGSRAYPPAPPPATVVYEPLPEGSPPPPADEPPPWSNEPLDEELPPSA